MTDQTSTRTDRNGTTCDCCGGGSTDDATAVDPADAPAGVPTDGDAVSADGGGSPAGADAPSHDTRWLDGDSVLDATLPEPLQDLLGRLVGSDSCETLGDWVTEVREGTGGGAIAVEDLCHADETTPHWGELDGERYHFRCFYDAVALAALVDAPVDIRTEGPDGTEITAHATPEGALTDVSGGAVLSFGVAEDVSPPDGTVDPEDVYGVVCPYVKAFPDVETYRSWARQVPAETVAMPLAQGEDLAVALAA